VHGESRIRLRNRLLPDLGFVLGLPIGRDTWVADRPRVTQLLQSLQETGQIEVATVQRLNVAIPLRLRVEGVDPVDGYHPQSRGCARRLRRGAREFINRLPG